MVRSVNSEGEISGSWNRWTGTRHPTSRTLVHRRAAWSKKDASSIFFLDFPISSRAGTWVLSNTSVLIFLRGMIGRSGFGRRWGEVNLKRGINGWRVEGSSFPLDSYCSSGLDSWLACKMDPRGSGKSWGSRVHGCSYITAPLDCGVSIPIASMMVSTIRSPLVKVLALNMHVHPSSRSLLSRWGKGCF